MLTKNHIMFKLFEATKFRTKFLKKTVSGFDNSIQPTLWESERSFSDGGGFTTKINVFQESGSNINIGNYFKNVVISFCLSINVLH